MRKTADGQVTYYIGEHYEVKAKSSTIIWGDSQLISSDSCHEQRYPNMVRGADGTLYLVWEEYPSSEPPWPLLFATYSPTSTEWSPPELVSSDDSGDNGMREAIAVTTDGTVYVAKTEAYSDEEDKVFVYRRVGNNNWSSDFQVNGANVAYLTTTPSGEVYMAVHRTIYTFTVYRRAGDGSWSQVHEVSAPASRRLEIGSITADSQGNVYIVYVEWESGQSSGSLKVISNRDGYWAEFLTPISSNADVPPPLPDIVTDQQDNVLVAWMEYFSPWVKVSKANPGTGSWILADKQAGSGPFYDNFMYQIDMVVDDANQVHVSYVINDPINLPQGVEPWYATMAAGPGLDNTLTVVWTGWTDGSPDRLDLYMTTGTVTFDSSITKHYYASGRRIATRVDGELYYLLGDHLGSTTVVADEQGNEVGHVVYDPYGEVLTSTLPLTVTDRLFTGQRYESDLGLYDYRARFYDPLVGSFVQADTLVPEVGQPRRWNRYGYVDGNPLNFTDPPGFLPM